VDDGRTDAIDPYFFAEYLRSLQRPEPVEARLITLHPSFRTVAVSIAELVEHGLVRAEESGSLASLTAESRAHEALLRELGERLAADGAITEDAFARRRGWLRARDRTDTKGSSLRALAETAPDDLATVLSDALEVRPVDARSSIALELIAQQDDPQHCAAVWALFCALDPSGAIPQPHLWARCSAFLLRHAFSVDRVIATLADAGGTEVGEAALLALEFAPPLGRPLLRKALRSPVPSSRRCSRRPRTRRRRPSVERRSEASGIRAGPVPGGRRRTRPPRPPRARSSRSRSSSSSARTSGCATRSSGCASAWRVSRPRQPAARLRRPRGVW